MAQHTQTVKNLPAMQETQVPSLVGKIPWRRAWQPTPVFLLGESHGQRSLAGCSPWGCKRVGLNSATKQQQQPLPVAVEAPRSGWILGVRCRQS